MRRYWENVATIADSVRVLLPGNVLDVSMGIRMAFAMHVTAFLIRASYPVDHAKNFLVNEFKWIQKQHFSALCGLSGRRVKENHKIQFAETKKSIRAPWLNRSTAYS